jgi:hypothetical protein
MVTVAFIAAEPSAGDGPRVEVTTPRPLPAEVTPPGARLDLDWTTTMSRLAMMCCIALSLAACDDRPASPLDAQVLGDIDAPIDGTSCRVVRTSPCSPLTQSGCSVGEKCTWMIDEVDPPIGHVGCALAGAIPLDGACATHPVGSCGSASDDCVRGAVCADGTCKEICDDQGGLPTCSPPSTCRVQPGLFIVGGTAVAGVCAASPG